MPSSLNEFSRLSCTKYDRIRAPERFSRSRLPVHDSVKIRSASPCSKSRSCSVCNITHFVLVVLELVGLVFEQTAYSFLSVNARAHVIVTYVLPPRNVTSNNNYLFEKLLFRDCSYFPKKKKLMRSVIGRSIIRFFVTSNFNICTML